MSLDLRRDSLTNCYANEGLAPFLKKMEEDFVVYKRPFSLLIADVDHFKSFNDKFGHLSGDEVLKYFSSSLRLDLEDEENFPFRFGGDEFVVVFPNKTAPDVYALAVRLKKNIKTRSCLIKGRQVKISFSGGIACFPHDATAAEGLFQKADEALYYSKNHGRGCITRHGQILQKKTAKALFFLVLALIPVIEAILFQRYYDRPAEKLKSFAQDIGSWLRGRASPPESPAAQTGEPTAKEPIRPRDWTSLESSLLSGVPQIVPEAASPVRETKPLPDTPPRIGRTSQGAVIVLKSGRSIQGIIVSEDDEEVELDLGLSEGRGRTRIKKAQIAQIQRG